MHACMHAWIKLKNGLVWANYNMPRCQDLETERDRDTDRKIEERRGENERERENKTIC